MAAKTASDGGAASIRPQRPSPTRTDDALGRIADALERMADAADAQAAASRLLNAMVAPPVADPDDESPGARMQREAMGRAD